MTTTPTGAPVEDDVSWLRMEDGAVVASLYCQPGARVTEPAGPHGDRVKVRLAAPPVEGKANEELVSWLSDELAIPRSAVRIVSGEASRQKRVRLDGVTREQALRLLGAPSPTR